jgi:CubicO group peptidase (beta-lactamase class C family)
VEEAGSGTASDLAHGRTAEYVAEDGSAGESDWTSPGVLAALAAAQAFDRQPGTAYGYSNVGYICLAAVVERFAASPFPDSVRDRIFEPLGMRASIFWPGPAPAPPRAATVPAVASPHPLSVGDGGLRTTVSDLRRWNEAIHSDALGITVRMHTPGTLDDGTALDYAWGVRVFHAAGQQLQSHGGDYGNATAKLVRLPGSSASLAVLGPTGASRGWSAR